MVRNSATTVSEYLKNLPPDRLATITAVRKMIKQNLPAGYAEAMSWGVISYEIPLKKYPKTHNRKPLMYAGLASLKNSCSLYLMCAYQPGGHLKQIVDAFAKAGKKLDMGKCCIRFKTADDLPLSAIGKIIAAVPPDKFIAIYESIPRKTR